MQTAQLDQLTVSDDSLPYEPYRMSVEEYKTFRQQGYLVVKGLIPKSDIRELVEHTEDLMQGRLPQQQAKKMVDVDPSTYSGTTCQDLEAPPEHLSIEEKAQFFLRIHMLHRKLALHERYMLHPRVLDVLEVLIGPDILALQTMLFIKSPGKPGQGWHQDSSYIHTHPDTLCGAWIAIDDCDEINGAMWFAAGSQIEPVYPPHGTHNVGDTGLSDIATVSEISNPDDEKNDLAKIADKYPNLLVSAKAGDVVFFGGHVLHRSKMNYSQDRFRRSFVSHYCNARSFTQWGLDETAAAPADPETGMANSSHILARGDSHLPFAKSKFGTPSAADLSVDERRAQSKIVSSAMGDMDSGTMSVDRLDPDTPHDE